MGDIDLFARIADNLVERVSGPMHFRIYLQPVIALVLATMDGLKDAKVGNPPYFWSLVTVPEHRREMLKSGWKSIGKVFILAIVLDAIYQIIALRFIYPGELIIVAFLLAIVPYLLFRGVVTRLAPKKS